MKIEEAVPPNTLAFDFFTQGSIPDLPHLAVAHLSSRLMMQTVNTTISYIEKKGKEASEAMKKAIEETN